MHTISGGRFGTVGTVVVVVVVVVEVVVVVVMAGGIVVVVVVVVVMLPESLLLFATTSAPPAATAVTAPAMGTKLAAALANPGPLPNTPSGPVLLTGAANSFCFSHSLLLSTIRAVKSSVRLSAVFLLRHSK
jgi:hypothetical protein